MNRRIIARAGLALALGFVLAACSSASAAPTWTYAPSTATPGGGGAAGASPAPGGFAATPAAPAATPASTPATTGGVLGTLEVTAVDLAFQPSSFSVDAPGAYEVRLVNKGSILHDLTFADGTKVQAEAGATATGTVTVPLGGLSFLCSIPGHADAGMKGTITVKGSTAAATPAPSVMPGMDGGGTTTAATPTADPNAPAYVLRDPDAPAVMSGSVHDVDFPIIETDVTVAPGFVVHAWTFGGTVPGPTLRVHLGDTVRVHLVNRGTMTHSIDFHASQTAMDHQMVPIKPGETFTYTFTADYAGVWMYHCGTAPTLHHIANGMFGMVIVEPKGGLAAVDREFAFVQSEWYLGKQGEPVDYAKASAGAPAPDFVAFNGVAAQYKDNPIAVTAHDRIRIFILDAGPNIDSSFHVVGTIFDTVYKEGVALLKGNRGGWGSQAVDLSPAQGAIIELEIPEDGSYAFVTHAFNFVGRGAVGVFKAGAGPTMSH